MTQYAVAIRDEADVIWIELYYADDPDHAKEQAKDANPEAEIAAVAFIPEV